MIRRLLAVAAAALCLAAAEPPSERLADPGQEARAQALFAELRCVVCQNESIADSQADLAGDLRKLVREQVAAGRTDVEVKRFMTDRYGDFVLLKPRFNPATAALWALPFLIVLAGIAWMLRRRATPLAGETLSIQEEARISALLDGKEPATVSPQARRTKSAEVDEA